MSELEEDTLSEITINLMQLCNDIDSIPPAIAYQVYERAIRALKKSYEDYRKKTAHR